MLYKHPIPRQITTFEFKLIGFLTLKQFIYLIVFLPLGYIFYSIIPVPFLNGMIGLTVALIGVAFAFLKIQDRELEVWLKNLIKSLTSPVIFIYRKKNSPPEYLEDIFSSISNAEDFFTSRLYLKKYLSQKTEDIKVSQKRTNINFFFSTSSDNLSQKNTSFNQGSNNIAQKTAKPFLSGTVKNSNLKPLPGILVYIKDTEGKPIRLMKTNPHGVFATFKPLKDGVYTIEAYDPTGVNTFDKIEITIDKSFQYPIELVAKPL